MSGHLDITPIYWTEDEPKRLARDLADVAAVAPDMHFQAPGILGGTEHHGMWAGQLPVWPLARPEPDGLDALVPRGLECMALCSASHPMIPPQVRPISPEPLLLERSQHKWHVAPAGVLCLMQSAGDWDPSDSVADLLVKAAAWRVEYALMKAGVIEAMSLSGIVSDASFDHLIAKAVETLTRTDAFSAETEEESV
jgi:hypothetical protein